MAIFATSRLSLDHRLRWNPQVRDLVTGLLGILEECIMECIRLGNPKLSLPERNELLAGGGFERTLLSVSEEITLLNEISNTIRKAGRKVQDEEASGDFTIKDIEGNDLEKPLREAWADDILDRFPGCSEIIRLRLASTMLLRRRRILYRRHRHFGHPFRALRTSNKPSLQPLLDHAQEEPRTQRKHISTDLEQKDGAPSLVASTAIRSATTLALPDFQNAQTPSVVSRSRTIALESHEGFVFPPAPGKLLDGHRRYCQEGTIEELEQSLSTQTSGLTRHDIDVEETCPFCLFILSGRDIKSQQKWREHITGDLEAYTCLLETCDEPLQMWTHSESWLKHIKQHSLQWRCPAKSHRDRCFMTQEEFQAHLEDDHTKKYSNAEMSLVMGRSRQSTGPLFTSCPLCGQGAEEVNGSLEKHIAGHLRSLALKSLPLLYDDRNDEDDDNDNDNQKSGDAISNRSTVLDLNSDEPATRQSETGSQNLDEEDRSTIPVVSLHSNLPPIDTILGRGSRIPSSSGIAEGRDVPGPRPGAPVFGRLHNHFQFQSPVDIDGDSLKQKLNQTRQR
ncbi:hypothetical protein FGRMN_4578 [Fusarium graminum]|nr:hypothetical protein FGRMN_4578 [Fusarium graminum]